MKIQKPTMKRLRLGALLLAALLLFSTAVFAAGQTVPQSEYTAAGATSFVFTAAGITVNEGTYSGYKIDGTSLTIKEAGTYILSGACEDGSIVIKKNVTGVTLVLNGLTLTASATAPLTCNKGSEVKIVAAAGTVNHLADDKYNNDDIYTDAALYPDIENAVIKCKDGANVILCGSGTLSVTANGKNGVKGGGDLYEEDANGNATDTLLSTASLTIRDLTLNITATVSDGLKADKELNILSGNITVSAADDGVKCDYVMNIGADGTAGPTVNVVKSKEGIEAATLNIYSGNITVNATDDGVNAANSDLTNYSFAYNQYGGTVYVNVTAGDGVDSNGAINLYGGTLEVYAPSQGDGDPLDSETGTNFKGATVLAVGHLGMMQGYTAETPYLTFGSTTGTAGGRMGGFGGAQTALVSAGGNFQITDEKGTVLYEAKAVRNASYILFASPALTSGASYTLRVGGEIVATTTAGTASVGGMGRGAMGGRQGQFFGGTQGQTPAEGQFPGGTQGQMPAQGQFPGANQGRMPGGRQGQRPTEGQFPGGEQGQAPAQGQFPRPADGQMQSGGLTSDVEVTPSAPAVTAPSAPSAPSADIQIPTPSSPAVKPETESPKTSDGTVGGKQNGGKTTAPAEPQESGKAPAQGGETAAQQPSSESNHVGGESAKDAKTSQKTEEKTNPPQSDGADAKSAPKTEQKSSWFFNLLDAIGNFFKSLFGRK